jgi:hypothetical protein
MLNGMINMDLLPGDRQGTMPACASLDADDIDIENDEPVLSILMGMWSAVAHHIPLKRRWRWRRRSRSLFLVQSSSLAFGGLSHTDFSVRSISEEKVGSHLRNVVGLILKDLPAVVYPVIHMYSESRTLYGENVQGIAYS